MDQEKIGKFISELRKAKKITQQELAEKIGVTDRAISNWENGRRLPDYSILKSLCKELNVTINELLSGEKFEKEEYQEKLEENIINLNIVNQKKLNRVLKIIGSLACLLILFIFLGICIYNYYEMDIKYDERTMKCSFKENALTYTIIGSSVLNTNYIERTINNTKYIIFHSTINIYNKRRSNWEYGESVARVANNQEIPFNSYWEFDKEENLDQKIIVYYSNKSLKKFEKLNDTEFLKEIENSFQMCSNEM